MEKSHLKNNRVARNQDLRLTPANQLWRSVKALDDERCVLQTRKTAFEYPGVEAARVIGDFSDASGGVAQRSIPL
jgi:hypothetical protein